MSNNWKRENKSLSGQAVASDGALQEDKMKSHIDGANEIITHVEYVDISDAKLKKISSLVEPLRGKFHT